MKVTIKELRERLSKVMDALSSLGEDGTITSVEPYLDVSTSSWDKYMEIKLELKMICESPKKEDFLIPGNENIDNLYDVAREQINAREKNMSIKERGTDLLLNGDSDEFLSLIKKTEPSMIAWLMHYDDGNDKMIISRTKPKEQPEPAFDVGSFCEKHGIDGEIWKETTMRMYDLGHYSDTEFEGRNWVYDTLA